MQPEDIVERVGLMLNEHRKEVLAYVNAALAAEREACARIIERIANEAPGPSGPDIRVLLDSRKLAAAIRARGASCMAPACQSCGGERTILGPFGESLLPCPECSAPQPFARADLPYDAMGEHKK